MSEESWRKPFGVEATGTLAGLSFNECSSMSLCKPIFCDLTSPNFAQSSSPILGDLQDPSFHNVSFEFGLAKESFSEAAAEQRLDWASAEDSDSDDTDVEQLSVDAQAELNVEAPEQPSGFQGHSSQR